jgi:hypothetical protein
MSAYHHNIKQAIGKLRAVETQGSGHAEVIDLWRGLKGLVRCT